MMQYSDEFEQVVNSEFIEIRDRITKFIIKEIKDGSDSWQMPWHDNILPINIISKKYYMSSINIFLLLEQRYKRNFSTNIWGTEKQWIIKKCVLNKGERNCIAYQFKPYIVNDSIGEKVIKFFFPNSLYDIFNSDQRRNFDLNKEFPESAKKLKFIEFFIQKTGVVVNYRDDDPHYNPSSDTIVLRPRENFVATDETSATDNYYSTVLHELIHWTGVSHRCNRYFEYPAGEKAEAFEELVAELGASFLCSCMNINIVPQKNNIDYIGSWLEILRDDEYALYNAADQAIEALKYLSELTNIDLTRFQRFIEDFK